ncbi:MAG: DnaJ domain-containing protein [Alkalinema sp. RU_4_3]|nr:DnaJ domain-containing protein [Alkalinema sp. RU_4_3]
MAQQSFSADWLQRLADPYAILGISVAADEKRLFKRYRTVAMRLHPDRFVQADKIAGAVAEQLIARTINPAYEKVKQEKNRAEVTALLRLQARRHTREGTLVPQSDIARELMRQPVHSADVFYEQAITALADRQFEDLSQFPEITQTLGELNLVYLQLKMGDLFREKRSGLISTAEVPTPPVAEVMQQQQTVAPTLSYSRRHFDRAQQYVQKCIYDKAIVELKDAIRLEPNHAEYHALMSYAYLRQDMSGMSKVYCRQALKFDPTNTLAKQVAQKIGLIAEATPTASKTTDEKRGLFSRFRR